MNIFARWGLAVILVTATVTAAAHEIVDDGAMSVDEFVRLVQDPSVDRIRFEAPSGGSNSRRSVYFLWGHLEAKWTNFQYAAALTPIRSLQRAGWTVLVDGWTTTLEARAYVADPTIVGLYWSSHGTPQGALTAWQDAGHYTALTPSHLGPAGRDLRFVVLCACYSMTQGNEFSARLNGAAVYGYRGTVTVEECAWELRNRFIAIFNKHL